MKQFALLVVALFAAVSAKAQEDWPSIREAKTIAEEGFIYGLPLVMNYAACYEF